MKCRSGGRGVGAEGTKAGASGLLFSMQNVLFHLHWGREGDTSSTPAQTEMAHFCVGESQVDSARELLWARGEEPKLSASSCTASSPLSPSPGQRKEKSSTIS